MISAPEIFPLPDLERKFTFVLQVGELWSSRDGLRSQFPGQTDRSRRKDECCSALKEIGWRCS